MYDTDNCLIQKKNQKEQEGVISNFLGGPGPVGKSDERYEFLLQTKVSSPYVYHFRRLVNYSEASCYRGSTDILWLSKDGPYLLLFSISGHQPHKTWSLTNPVACLIWLYLLAFLSEASCTDSRGMVFSSKRFCKPRIMSGVSHDTVR